MRFNTLSIAVLVSIAYVHAVTYNVQKTDSYDDLGPQSVLPPLKALTSDGGITYNQFNVISNQPQTILTGITPVSPPNLALVVAPAQGSLATTGRCFQLNQLYFGCTLMSGEGEANIPLPCNLTLTAYGGANRRVGQQNYTFTPNNPLVSNMQVANVVLPYADVIVVDANINLGGRTVPTNGITALLFDNVTYVQYDNAATNCGF